MVLMDVLQIVSLVTLAISGLLLYYERSKVKKMGFYTIPEWNFFLKKLWAKWYLKSQQRNVFEYVSDFKLFKSEEFSIVENERSTDYNLFYGSDQNGSSLLLKMVKRLMNTTEVWIVLRLSCGRVYTLLDPIILPTINTGNPNKFQAEGLTFECLKAYKLWRLTFNGLLKQINRKMETTSDSELRFIKFNFFWTAAAPPKHWPYDWSLNLRASAIATEKWRSPDWLNYLPTPKFGGYDQFGTLYGEVHLQKEDQPTDVAEMETIELNLPGIRQRRFLPAEPKTIRRLATIIGVCRDGSLYILGAESYEENLTQSQFGFVRNPNGRVFRIDWTDFHLAHLAEQSHNIPTALSIRFKANKKMYSTTLYFRIKRVVELDNTFPQNGFVNTIPLELGLNGERGTGLCMLWYPRNIKETINLALEARRFRPIVISYSETLPNREQFVYMFNDEPARSLQCSGGKGASLALMQSILTNEKKLEYIVPAGFVLSVSALELQIRKNVQLRDAIFIVKNAASGIGTEKLQESCAKTVEVFLSCPLELEITAAITSYYEQLRSQYLRDDQNGDFRVAVRSSAIGEDSEDASSAGQNATILGLSNLNDVLIGVQRCWSSLYTYQSVEYRRQHLQPINAQMAVIIQIMIPADCAGVMFTCHPTTGDPSKMLLTANYGLGESVVSGTIEPDVYILTRKYQTDHVDIVQTKLGKKTHAMEMSTDENSIDTREIGKDQQDQCCLDKDQAIRLAKIGVALEKCYGSPRDIEWAYYKNHIYLLQSRPITTLNAWSNWELLHEYDTPIMSDDDGSSFANVGEVFPDLTTPLTYSAFMQHFNKCTGSVIRMEEEQYDGLFSLYFLSYCHRICFDVYNIFLVDAAEERKLVTKLIGLTVFGYDFVTDEMNRIAIHRNGIISIRTTIQRILHSIKILWQNKAKVATMKKLLERFSGRYSDENLHEFKDHDALHFNSVIDFDLTDEDCLDLAIRSHNNTTQVSSFLQMIMLLILIEGNGDLRADHYADIALLLGSCKNVESAEIPKHIEDISNEIYLTGRSMEFVECPKENGLHWLEANCKSAFRLFNEFIRKNYHRGLKELDLGSQTWGMKPEMVIEMIQFSLKGFTEIVGGKIRHSNLSNADIIARLKTPKKKSTRVILRWILPYCKEAIRLREITKSQLTAFIHEVRKAYRHLATLMHREGLLPNKELIFYMSREDIQKLVTKSGQISSAVLNKGLIVQKAMRRYKLFQSWQLVKYSDYNTGRLRPLSDPIFGDWDANSDGVYVIGAPVCEGIVKGRACVITSFANVSEIQAGDILITHSTDVGWSPFFPILAGIVTELGGLLSHGAVVAREYGLPCVIGAALATRKVKHGEIVILNATKGLVLKSED